MVLGFGFLVSLLPIWRSGEKRGLIFWEFVGEHTVFSSQRQWVKMKDKESGDAISVELVEGEPKSKFLYQSESGHYKGALTGYL